MGAELLKPLTAVGDGDLPVCGGKAVHLASLLRAGFPVPPGSCLTSAALHAFVDRAAVRRRLVTAAGEAAALDVLRAASWPPAVRRALERAWRDLGPPLAVRSSAADEDGQTASFAGQFRTVLNVASPEQLADAVLEVWASAWSERLPPRGWGAGAYAADGPPEMAVILQRMTPAEVSGACFTHDPVTGDRDVLVVNASYGLGEAVLSGAVAADHVLVDRESLGVREYVIGEKARRLVPRASGLTAWRPVPGAWRGARCLTADDLFALGRLALRVEAMAGCPQDIEFALSDGQLWLTQARPITDPHLRGGRLGTRFGVEAWVSEFDSPTDERTEWTAANIQEAVPGPVTPLTWSMMRVGNRVAFTQLYRHLGLLARGDRPEFSGLFYSRPFLNLSAFSRVARSTPLVTLEAVEEQVFGRQVHEKPGLSRLTPHGLWQLIRHGPRLALVPLRLDGTVHASESEVGRFAEGLAAADLSRATVAELEARWREYLNIAARAGAVHIACSACSSGAYEMLDAFLGRWLGARRPEVMSRLCTGLRAVESALPGYEMWELSRVAARRPEVAALLRTTEAGEVVAPVRASTDGELADFRAGLDSFLRRFGHRSVGEGDMAWPTWAEDPTFVVRMVQTYLDAPEARSPRAALERQMQVRERTERWTESRVPPPLRPVYRRLLREAQRFVALRERTKGGWIRAAGAGRPIVRECAHRLVVSGRTDSTDDVFFLTWQEMVAALRRQLVEDLRPRIQHRRAEHERNREVRLPERFLGRPRPLSAADGARAEAVCVLHGIAVSPGCVTGRARVVLDPRGAMVEPGEVLVAPVTDAGWTPLFLVARALVVDIGGPLSHGSTVAREYGLPAVVNVKVGTRTIRDGQRVTVDGTRGVVYVHPAEEVAIGESSHA